jgi:hypothetical protein
MLHDWHMHLCGAIYAAGMATAWLVGQVIPAAPETTSDWAAIVSVLGSLGFSIWFGWYTTTKTLPEMRREHVLALKEMTASFVAELKEERQQHASNIGRLEDAIDGLSEQLRQRP